MRIYDTRTGRLDVDLMITLAEIDPDALQREREEVLEYAISRAQPDRQKHLKQLCFQQQVEVRHYKNNTTALLDAQWKQFLQTMCIFIHGLEGRDVRDAYKRKNTQTATIISFPSKC